MNVNRILTDWVLPPKATSLARKVLRGRGAAANAVPHSPPSLGAANTDLLMRHRGERCFILATGPSINSQDLAPLKNELCIGASFFFLHPQASVIRPRYHMIAPNHPPFDFDLPDRYLRGIVKAYSHDYELVYGHLPYPFSARDYLAATPEIGDRLQSKMRTFDYSADNRLGEHNYADEAMWDVSGHPFVMRTVIYGGIQLASYMGCSEIVLVGCDHNYLNELGRTNNHFYADKDGNPRDAKHLEEFTSEKWFFEYYSRWRDYRLMMTYLSSKGRTLVNATAGGMLDVFPRRELSSFFR